MHHLSLDASQKDSCKPTGNVARKKKDYLARFLRYFVVATLISLLLFLLRVGRMQEQELSLLWVLPTNLSITNKTWSSVPSYHDYQPHLPTQASSVGNFCQNLGQRQHFGQEKPCSNSAANFNANRSVLPRCKKRALPSKTEPNELRSLKERQGKKR